MPTVIALDVSLSMSRPVPMADTPEEYQRRHLAVHGINTLLDFIINSNKMEFISLVAFSYLWEILVPFTRDTELVKAALTNVEEYSKTCLETMLTGVAPMLTDEWGSATSSTLVVITDGSSGVGPGSLKHSLQTLGSRGPEEKFPLPFSFPCKLIVVCISNPNDLDLKSSLPMYQKLVDLNETGGGGEVFVPDGTLSLKTVQAMFQRVADTYYVPFFGVLRCGNLKCNVQLFPPPLKYENATLGDKTVSTVLDICGFLDIGDASSPAVMSRHLVLPMSGKEKTKTDENGDSEENSKKEEEDVEGDGKIPSFTVLLHGSLKVEGMVALAKLSDDWFGILYSWADSKKKSNLMLSVFYPGPHEVSWLGNLNNLAPTVAFPVSPYGEDDNKTPFPIRPLEKRSYAQSCVVWIKASGLQADLQKVLRHAKKLPDKQQHFYKELNRLRRAALSFGFFELLEAMAAMLERECTMLPGTAHPDAALQLTHAVNALRGETATDIQQVIIPLCTNFSQDD
ncbi:hypothetical protein ScPMuIL_018000 [Solemya velum]